MWSTLWLFVLKSLQVNSAVRAVAEGAVCAALPERNWNLVVAAAVIQALGLPQVLVCFSHKHCH